MSLFLLRYTNSATTTASSLSMLTSHTKTPVVTKTTVSTDFLHALKILTKLCLQAIGHNLGIFAILDVFLPVQEPLGDLVLARITHDCHNLFNLFFSHLSGTF